MQTWKKACTNPIDQKVEEELRKVSSCPPSLLGHHTAPPRWLRFPSHWPVSTSSCYI